MNKAMVRKAQFGDEEGIHHAHMESIKEVCSKDYTSEQINAWGGRKYSYESKRNLIESHHVWVVEQEGSIEGYGLLFMSDDEKKAEIGALYLTPRVLKQGLGQEIVDHMKKTVISLGLKEIYLSSTKTSKKFYEKQGFWQYEADDSSPIGGISIEGHPMKIEL